MKYNKQMFLWEEANIFYGGKYFIAFLANSLYCSIWTSERRKAWKSENKNIMRLF